MSLVQQSLSRTGAGCTHVNRTRGSNVIWSDAVNALYSSKSKEAAVLYQEMRTGRSPSCYVCDDSGTNEWHVYPVRPGVADEFGPPMRYCQTSILAIPTPNSPPGQSRESIHRVAGYGVELRRPSSRHRFRYANFPRYSGSKSDTITQNLRPYPAFPFYKVRSSIHGLVVLRHDFSN